MLITTIKRIDLITDDRIKRALKSCVKPQRDGISIQLRMTKDAIEALEIEKRKKIQEDRNLNEEFNEFERKEEEEANTKDLKWKRDIKNTFMELKKFRADIPKLKSSLDAVKTNMTIFTTELNTSHTESSILENKTISLENAFFNFFSHGIPPIEYGELISIMKHIKISDIKAYKKYSWHVEITQKMIPGPTVIKRQRRY
jgi:hypothetical protein